MIIIFRNVKSHVFFHISEMMITFWKMMIMFFENDHQMMIVCSARRHRGASQRAAVLTTLAAGCRKLQRAATEHSACPWPLPHPPAPGLFDLRSAGTAWPNFRGAPLVWVSGLSGGAPSLKTSSFWWGRGRDKFSFP